MKPFAGITNQNKTKHLVCCPCCSSPLAVHVFLALSGCHDCDRRIPPRTNKAEGTNISQVKQQQPKGLLVPDRLFFSFRKAVCSPCITPLVMH